MGNSGSTAALPIVVSIALAVVGGLLGLALFVLAIVWIVFAFMKSFDPYRESLAAAEQSPKVAAALGRPLEADWVVAGRIKNGQADIRYGLTGPLGRGTVYVQATQGADGWTYQKCQLELEGGATIDLVPELGDSAR